MGGLLAFRRLIRGDSDQMFLVIWLGVWMAGEVLATSEWLWNAFGNEVIGINIGQFRHRRVLFGRGYKEKEFPLSELSNLRAAGVFGSLISPDRLLRVWGLVGGSMAVDHGKETHRFGVDLEEKDARELVEALKRYFS
jgi:hypothetical protein